MIQTAPSSSPHRSGLPFDLSQYSKTSQRDILMALHQMTDQVMSTPEGRAKLEAIEARIRAEESADKG